MYFSFWCFLFLNLFKLFETGAADKFIVNGKDAAITDFPYTVGLYYSGYFTCGASIYNQEWVITAAHCLYDVSTGTMRDPSLFSIQAGSSELNKGTSAQVVNVVTYDKPFNINKPLNDIALLQLKTPLDFGDSINSVGLPFPLQSVAPGTPVTILGWGFSKDKQPMNNLQKAVLQIVDLEKCKTIYGNKHDVEANNICAMHPGGGIGQCTGDSGGPLILKGSLGPVQVGVVSFSEKPCANSVYPGVFAKLSYYVNWMRETAGNQ